MESYYFYSQSFGPRRPVSRECVLQSREFLPSQTNDDLLHRSERPGCSSCKGEAPETNSRCKPRDPAELERSDCRCPCAEIIPVPTRVYKSDRPENRRRKA